MLAELQRELTSGASNAQVFARLQDGAARRIRMTALNSQKSEWMGALSTLESFFVVVCARRFTIHQAQGSVVEPIPPVLLILFLWSIARGLLPLGGFAYTTIDGKKRHVPKKNKDEQYRWSTVHQMLKAVYAWSEYHGVVAPQVCGARAREDMGVRFF